VLTQPFITPRSQPRQLTTAPAEGCPMGQSPSVLGLPQQNDNDSFATSPQRGMVNRDASGGGLRSERPCHAWNGKATYAAQRSSNATYAPVSHFFMKLLFAAPASFFPSFPTAPASQHFFIELALAAPASALPSLPTAFATQAAPSATAIGRLLNAGFVNETAKDVFSVPDDELKDIEARL
jgi:hypothetical protein